MPRWIALWLLAVLAAWAGSMAPPAHAAHAAEDAILERAYWRDAGGQRSLEEVRGQPFTTYTGLLTQGYHRHAAYWLRLKVRAGDPASPPYVLRVRPLWHDDLQLFDAADPRPAPRVGGERHPWSAREFPTLAPSFLIPKTAVDRDVYLRVQSIHTYLVDVQALEQADVRRADWKAQIVYLAYFSFLTLIVIWSFTAFVIRPEKVIGTFAAYQVVQVAYAMFMVGFAPLSLDGYVDSEVIDAITTVVIILCTFVGLQFHRVLIGEYRVRPLFQRPIQVISMLPLLSLLLLAGGEATWAVQFNSFALLCFAVASVLVVWLGIKPESGPAAQAVTLPRWTLSLFYTAVLFVGAIGVVPLMGWYGAVDLSLHAFLVHSGLVTVVMGALLQYRSRKLNDQHIEQLASAREKAAQERRARLEQNHFMSMLNHEMRTPMAVLKMLVDGQSNQKQAEASIDSMASLLERCLLSDSLDSQANRIACVAFSPAEVLRDCVCKTRAQERFALEVTTQQPIESDPELFAVIVDNLLDNALKYALAGSVIRVVLRDGQRDGMDVVCLSVANAVGRAGVPDLERVFDKYYRAESAKSIPGTGLGMHLVKSFSELLGGEVECVIEASAIRFQLCLLR